jgi:4'-phosphopantetheinyl transferase
MLRYRSGRALLQSGVALAASAARVDVWGVELDCERSIVDQFAGLLDAAELERAKRFRTTRLRERFIVAHGAVRVVLSRYVAESPTQLRFADGEFGKPELVGESRVRFNLSHSDSRALIAVTHGRPVGADIEWMRSDVDVLGIAGRYFFGFEHQDIRAAVPSEQIARFFAYWVAKESILKGEGLGIGYALERFGVQFDTARFAAGITTVGADAPSSDWRIQMLDAGAGWAAAVACRGTDWVVCDECE